MPDTNLIITAHMLRDAHQCARRVWLDHQQPDILRTDPALFDTLTTLGIRHEQQINAATPGPLESLPVGPWQEGVELTRDLMRQGVSVIAGAQLELSVPLDLTDRIFTIRGKIDQLVRMPGTHGLYAPIEIKQRSEPQHADWLQLDLYVWLASALQNQPVSGELWLGVNGAGLPARRVPHEYDEDRLMNALANAIRVLDEPDAPPVQLLPHCKACPWRAACETRAQENLVLDLPYGVSRRTRANLAACGRVTLDRIAAQTPEALQTVKGIGPRTAPAIRANAQAWVQQTPAWFGDLPAECHQPGWMFDLETLEDGTPWSLGWCDPEGRTVIALVAPVRAVEARTLPDGQHVILAPDSDAAWRAFAQAMRGDDLPIFHWTSFDSATLDRTGPPDVKADMLPRMHDLHQVFTHSVSLPTRSTSIKVVSAYLGFTWRSSQNWFDAFLDYQNWLADDSEAALVRACEYQREDVQSMAHVWRWMQASFPGTIEPPSS